MASEVSVNRSINITDEVFVFEVVLNKKKILKNIKYSLTLFEILKILKYLIFKKFKILYKVSLTLVIPHRQLGPI